jgi:NAD(P)-dependent dehydrogenase (short-subunit alcohol dehydrogenase family)
MSDNPAALVTGASRGIGRAIAQRLGELNYSVVVNYARSKDEADSIAAWIGENGGHAVAVQGDVGLAADRQRLIDTALHAFGRIDVLVNNAGITSQGRMDLLEATEKSWDVVFDTNLKGPFFLSQLASKTMIAGIASETMPSGKIINISSLSAYAVSTNRADYCMSKAAMGMMTKLLAKRLADEQIQVFELCPGVIASDMTAPVREKYDELIAEGLTPIRRWGQPEDVAAAVEAIVTDRFPFSTGECINIDGGFHIRSI